MMNLPTHLLALLASEPATSRATSTRGEASAGARTPGKPALVPAGEGERELSDDEEEGPPRRGRKPVATPARLAAVCARLALGDTERGACLAAGLGLTSWNTAKRGSRELRARVEAARQEGARLRHAQHTAARLESQWARAAGQKAAPPRPTKNARLVAWHLTHRVSLSLAALPAAEVAAACERFGLSVDAWTRQEHAFGLLAKVYARRAKIRGDRPATVPPAWFNVATLADWTEETGGGDYADRFRA